MLTPRRCRTKHDPVRLRSTSRHLASLPFPRGSGPLLTSALRTGSRGGAALLSVAKGPSPQSTAFAFKQPSLLRPFPFQSGRTTRGPSALRGVDLSQQDKEMSSPRQIGVVGLDKPCRPTRKYPLTSPFLSETGRGARRAGPGYHRGPTRKQDPQFDVSRTEAGRGHRRDGVVVGL